MPCLHILLASSLQYPEKSCLRILLLHRGELQEESLAALAVLLEFVNLPSPNGFNDGPVVQIIDPGLPKRHIVEMLHIRLPRHAIIWLGLMPVSPPLLSPGPLRSSSLSSTTSLNVFADHIDEIHLIKEICNDLLLLGLWGLEVKIQVP